MTKIRQKKNIKKANLDKNQGYKIKSQKQIQNNISNCEKIFEELDKAGSHTSAEIIEKEISEKIDDNQNNLTDFEQKLSQIKSTNETDNYKINKKIYFKRKTIIKLRRENLFLKKLKNLKKNKHKTTFKIFQIKNNKDSLNFEDISNCESFTKETPTKKIKNIIKEENIIKPELEDKKIDEKKSLIKKDKNSKKYISKTEKAEDKKINILKEENINNDNGDNMSLSLSENNNNNEQTQNNEKNNIINNNNIRSMSISSSDSNPNVFMYSENHINTEENVDGIQNNNQNPTENNVVQNMEINNDNNLNDDFENNNNNIVEMNDYVNYLNNLPEEEINYNINNNNGDIDDNDDNLQNPNLEIFETNKRGI